MAKRYKTSKEKRKAQKLYRRRRKIYEEYKKKFEKRKQLLESRGIYFYDPNVLSYIDWKSTYAEKYNDLKLDVKEGKRKSIGDVNREIISDQAYELSANKGEIIGEYLLREESDLLEEMDLVYKYTDAEGIERINLKKKIALMQKIRQGEFVRKDIKLWEKITTFRDEYFDMSKEEQAKLMKKWGKETFAEALRKEVGQTFFNSPD